MRVARSIRRVSTTVTLAVAALSILMGSGVATAHIPGADLAPRGGPTVSSADDVTCLQLSDARTNDICPCVIPAAPADFMPTMPLPANVNVDSVPAETIIVSGDCR
jgi:hypothetical protein